MRGYLYAGTFYEFEPEVALAPQWLREAFKKITILFIFDIHQNWFYPPYLLTKNHYIKNVSKNTEKQLICSFSQPPEPPVL